VRLFDPSIDQLESILATPPSGEFTIQFSRPETYNSGQLALVNEICSQFGRSATVRFFGHYRSHFDCAVLLQLNACRSMRLDFTHGNEGIKNFKAVSMLSSLENFHFSVFEGNYDEVLLYKNLQSLEELGIGASRRNDWNLEPLRDFRQLRCLSIVAQHRNMEVVSALDLVSSLSLFSIHRQISLAFVSGMKGLRRLKIMAGGRDNIDEVALAGLTDLSVTRVKGLSSIDCSNFPALQVLEVDDQVRISTLDLSRNKDIRHIRLVNCKNLKIINIENAENLASICIGATAIDSEDLLAGALPAGLAAMDLWGYGSRRDAEIDVELRERGYRSVYRDLLH